MDWKLFRIKLYGWTCVLRVPALLTSLTLLGASVGEWPGGRAQSRKTSPRRSAVRMRSLH
jgi:hypothetical protein